MASTPVPFSTACKECNRAVLVAHVNIDGKCVLCAPPAPTKAKGAK